MNTTSTPLSYGKEFHIYNRGINSTELFIEVIDFSYFSDLFKKYISPVADTYSYCLMRNHFHFYVRIKAEDEIGFIQKKETDDRDFLVPKKFNPSRQFGHLFDSYSKGFNKKYSRTGKLFETPFRRIPVNNNEYAKELIRYIHFNPVEAGITKQPENYWWSSANNVFCEKYGIVDDNIYKKLFGSKQKYFEFMNQNSKDSNWDQPEW